jgi:uracil phosphoribosyltransferase
MAQLRIYVPPHPLIKHWLAVARDASTPSPLFRSAMKELGRWLAYEAIREWLPVEDTVVYTPLDTCAATMVNPEVPIVVLPILRAGLALLEGVQEVVPLASIHHLGMVRNEENLDASCYLNNLPERFPPETRLLICEPMLATGGTIMQTMELLVQRGIDPARVRILSVVAAPPALQKLSQAYPTLVLYSAGLDETLNEQGYIVPGLGDAGDRAFGT